MLYWKEKSFKAHPLRHYFLISIQIRYKKEFFSSYASLVNVIIKIYFIFKGKILLQVVADDDVKPNAEL